MSGARDRLAQSFLHNLCREILDPAGFAETMAALQPCHAGVLVFEEANVAILHHRHTEVLERFEIKFSLPGSDFSEKENIRAVRRHARTLKNASGVYL